MRPAITLTTAILPFFPTAESKLRIGTQATQHGAGASERFWTHLLGTN
jgi:hypothetical protein